MYSIKQSLLYCLVNVSLPQDIPMFVDKLQSELLELIRKIKSVEAEKQSCIEEVTAQKQQVKFLRYQLQQISNITEVYRLSDHF